MARVVTSCLILVSMVTGSVQMQKLIGSMVLDTDISRMTASRHGDIYVGTMNKIYHLNSELVQISSVVMETAREREHFINVLFLVENFTTDIGLVTCGVLSGCQMRNLANISIYSDIIGSKREDMSRLATPILFAPDGCIRMGSTYDLFNVFFTKGFSYAKLNEEKTRLTSCGIPDPMNLFDDRELVNNVSNFVYGFSIGNLDYYFMNQAKYGATVSKFCQKDPYAYSEMPIRCAGEEYNVLKAMQYTRINQSDGLLVGVFTTSNESRSAVCLYKYSDFQNVMVENIKECFNGTNYFKPYLKRNTTCRKQYSDTLLNPIDYLCTKLVLYNKVVGNSPAVGEVILYDGNNSFKPLTAVGVVHISRRTLVLLGSLAGHVDEIIQNTDGSWSRSNSFDLGTSSSTGRDILFDGGRRHFYVFSKSKVFKFRLQNCDDYKYCHLCLAHVKHTVCGWCVLQNKCGILEDCESKIWLQGPAERECPVVTKIIPPALHINSTQKHVKVQLNHQVPNDSNYVCSLSFSDLRFPATVGEDTVSCDLSSNWNYPSLSVDGLILVNVSIFSNWSGDAMVSGMLTVYDCSHVTRCTQCTRTDFSCIWCFTRNKCINEYEICSDGDKMVEIADGCPKINIDKTGIINVPYRVPDVFRYIHGENFPNGTYTCKLNFSNEHGVGERLNSTMVRCKFNLNTTVVNASGVTSVSLWLLLEPNISIEINNTSKMEAHNATTAPLVLQRSDVECQTTSLKIFVPKNLVPGNGTVTWRDSACVVYSNGTHFVDSVGLRDCGTTLTLEADSVVFENDLILHKNGTQMQNGNNIVTYGSDYEFAIPVKCVYPRNSNISTSYIPIVQQVRIMERRNGQLDLTMRQYEAEDYRHPVPFNAYPRQVPLNNDIFIRLAMENNVTGLGLSADNCFATSTPSPVDQNWYQLISSGCPVNNAKIHPSGINDVKFSFHAFNFRLNTSGIVYVHCQVSVCLDTDPACVVGCMTRKKRSASAREGAITSNLISTGPFILAADEGGEAMSTVVAAVSITIAVIATVVAIIGWTRKSKKGADS